MKKALIYGAGNIGRGFIGTTFSDSGYSVCFIDINKEIIQRINQDGRYPVNIVSNEERKPHLVDHVRAVDGMDSQAVADEMADADIMATSVGVNVLPHIIKNLSAGLKKRFEESGRPLDIIICENMMDADRYLRRLIEKEMGSLYKAVLDDKLGLVEASIGRMVPVMTEQNKQGNPLMVWVEPYDELPVDKAAFKDEIPAINGIVPFSPFGFYIKRKLFIHNMSHAMCAYLGFKKGYKYIYECVNDQAIRVEVRAAMRESAKALHSEYDIPMNQIEAHIDDLLHRFGNVALADTVERVARDPLRKLKANDRLIGAALYCMAQGIDPKNVAKGIATALEYDNSADDTAVKMKSLINDLGIIAFLVSYCGLPEDSPLTQMIIRVYN